MTRQGDHDRPDDLRELDRTLRAVDFEPRASLGAEIHGRIARGENPGPFLRPRRPLVAAAAAAVLLLAASGALLLRVLTPDDRLVDRCCVDFDGGEGHDDGVVVTLRPDGRIKGLLLYEDVDGSRSRTAADVIRFNRGELAELAELPIGSVATINRCCLDLDGGGAEDDGVLVLGHPPDRVFMAAVYETGGDARQRGAPLR